MSSINDVTGIKVGHYTDRKAATGCTVILCEAGAAGGVDVRGSSPGTRETDLLRPMNAINEVHAILLSGGSAFGLDAASGVVRYLEENDIGLHRGEAIIPIVPAAILYDLGLVTHKIRPGADDGYSACERASDGPIAEGSIGAGTGATVCKLLGADHAVKGGIGTASIDLGDGLIVGAIVAVNAIGGIYDIDTGEMIAGPREDDGVTMRESMALITAPGFTRPERPSPSNTTIGVVATNAVLTKEQANKLASVAHDGLAMAIRPAHTMGDGDTMFALATGTLEEEADMNRLCAASALCVGRAIVRGVRNADGIGGIPSIKELGKI
ncbi:MAG: P1 family peptidase [Chloroflexi bacterium]|nr:P1 family peptidase [Chloroflexota bacterium]